MYKKPVIDAGYDVERRNRKILVDGCRDLADACLVDARALDSEEIHRRSIYRWTRQSFTTVMAVIVSARPKASVQVVY